MRLTVYYLLILKSTYKKINIIITKQYLFA